MRSEPIIGVRFPFRFDVARLQSDLARARREAWTPHYNERDFGGQWSGIALRSGSGLASDLVAAPPGADAAFRATPLLARCEYFREALAAFKCPLKSVRLLSLAPGSYIREHSDNALGFEDGEIRIHIPVATNSGVEFYVCGERLLLEEGGCYYVNVNLPHRVNNRGGSDRVHLVIDAEVNDWVRGIFRECGEPVERSALRPGNLEEFRKVVLGDQSLQEILRDIPDEGEFTGRILSLGRERGFDFNEGDMHAGFRSRPVPVSQTPGAGWVPVKVGTIPELEVEFIWTGSRRFTEPFFEDTIRAALRNPFARLFRCVSPIGPTRTLMAPSGFIFHMSRCGSTLISQMLASLPGARVISEAPPVDEILQCALPEPQRVEALQAVIGLMGNASAGAKSRYFVKLDAWHIHHLALIRKAFPGVRWIFAYRDPVEVLASHLRIPGRHAVPGAMDPAALELDCGGAELTRTQWCGRVLGALCRKALDFREDPDGLFVNYNQLPEAVAGRIGPHFGLSLTPAEERRMVEVSCVDAKNPSFLFEPDNGSKTETGIEPELMDLYQRLGRGS